MRQLSPLRIVVLLLLSFAGALGVACLTTAISLGTSNAAEAIFLAGLGLLSTLAYPGLLDLEYHMFGNPSKSPRLPMYVYDTFFLGGALIAANRLAPQMSVVETIGISFFLGIVAGAAARRRAAELDGTAPK